MLLSGLFHRTPQPWTTRRVLLDGAPLRVLVVDDNQNAALAMAAYLCLEAIESRAVFGGVEAIDASRQWAPHVILMDLTMPHCDGFEAACRLRRDPRTAGIILVAHTALDESEVRRHLAAAEFDGYFQKAQPIDQLVRLVREFVH
jgi:two-component system OmpR family response regulator